MSTITIACTDGRMLGGHWLRAASALATIIISPATGVRRGFYSDFCKALSDDGFDVLLWDARGIGDSLHGSVRDEVACMRDWGQLDLDAVIRHARADHLDRPLFLLGHSSGGHLAGLAGSLPSVDGVVLLAAGTCDWRRYPQAQWPRLLGAWFFAIPVLTALFGYLPGRFGIGQDLPAGVVREWRRWSLQRGYLFADETLDCGGYASYCGPLLSVNVSDDLGFSPEGAVSDLLSRFTSARIERRTINAGDRNRPVGHFGFFRQHNADLWADLITWLHDRCADTARSRCRDPRGARNPG